jgi:hypothetical protein
VEGKTVEEDLEYVLLANTAGINLGGVGQDTLKKYLDGKDKTKKKEDGKDKTVKKKE